MFDIIYITYIERFFVVQVHFIPHGVTCQVAVHKSVHDLVRCAATRNFTAIANILWRNAQSRLELVKVVQRAVANEFAALCSTKDNSKFRCTNDDNLEASFMKQKEEIELKAPVMWEIISAASINMNHNMAINSIILRRGGADKMTFKQLSTLNFYLSYRATLKLQASFG